MSVYASFDHEPGDQFATNKGWGDFVRWAGKLSPDNYASVVHLAEYGWAKSARLADQLTEAAKEFPPEAPGLDSVVKSLIAMVGRSGGAEAVFVNDGMTA